MPELTCIRRVLCSRLLATMMDCDCLPLSARTAVLPATWDCQGLTNSVCDTTIASEGAASSRNILQSKVARPRVSAQRAFPEVCQSEDRPLKRATLYDPDRSHQ